MELLPDLDQMIAAVAAEAGSDDALEQLAAAARTRDALEHRSEVLLDHFVERARNRGSSWSQIGNALGVSKQAAQQRHTATDSVARRLLTRLPGRGHGARRQLFERFTDPARTAVVRAREEALRLDHDRIGTEHILLGLMRVDDGLAAMALTSVGVSLDDVRRQVAETVDGGQAAPADHLPFSASAKKVVELSLREALQLGHDHIGTEHILLALVRDRKSGAAQTLERLGADADTTREAIKQLLDAVA